MKTKFKYIATIVAVAFTVGSCAKLENAVTPSSGSADGKNTEKFAVTFNCVIEDPDIDAGTKTAFNDGKTGIKWVENDRLKFYQYASVNGTKTLDPQSRILTNEDIVGGKLNALTLEFQNPTIDSENKGYYGSIYPETAISETSFSDGQECLTCEIVLPSSQNPTQDSFDPKADLLISKLNTVTEIPESILLQYARVVAMGNMTVEGLDANSTIKSVSFSAKNSSGPVSVAGNRKYELYADHCEIEETEGGVNEILLDYGEEGIPATDGQFTAYFTCYPFELTTGDSFIVTLETSSGDFYSKTVSLPNDRKLAFKQGRGSVFKVNMSNCKVVAKYSEDGGQTWAYAKNLETAVEAKEGTAENHIKVQLLADDTYSGQINLNNRYIEIDGGGGGHTYNVSNRGNYAVFAVTTDDENGYVSFKNITFDGGDESIDQLTERQRLLYVDHEHEIKFGESTTIQNFAYVLPETGEITSGGVIYNRKGTITMDGLTITNCGSKQNNSEKDLYGGFISNYGGTIVVSGENKENNIRGCFAIVADEKKSCRGGFIYNTSNGTTTISKNTTISSCTAPDGAVIYVHSGSATIKDGAEINSANAICIGNTGTVNVKGSNTSITGGTDESQGSAFDVRGGTLSISGGKISGYGGTNEGGAQGTIYCTGGEVKIGVDDETKETTEISGDGWSSAIRVNGGTVTMNNENASVKCLYPSSSSSTNPQVRVQKGTFNLKSGVIGSNVTSNSQRCYRGISISGGKLDISGGELRAYNAIIYCDGDPEITISGGLLQNGNSATTANPCAFYITSKCSNATITIKEGGIKNTPRVHLYKSSNNQGSLVYPSGSYTDIFDIQGGYYFVKDGSLSQYVSTPYSIAENTVRIGTTDYQHVVSQ